MGGRACVREGEAVLARLEALVAAAGELRDLVAGCQQWRGGQRRAALAALDKLAGALAPVRGALLVAEQRSAGGVRAGDRDFVAARARATRTGLGETRRQVRQATTLDALPAVADAVGAGRVPLAHLDALARVAESAGQEASVRLADPGVQERLVRMAEHQSVREFTTAAARLVASFDPHGWEESAQAQRRERFLTLSHRPEGVFMRGRFDHVAAHVLRTALAAVGTAPDETRTKEQADADALIALAERAMTGMAGIRPRATSPDGGLLPDPEQDRADARVTGTATRPTVSLLIPADTFAELHRAQAAATGEGAAFGLSGEDEPRECADRAATPSRRAVEPAALDDGTPVPMSQVARILCDSEIARIVLNAEGLPLDLGRSQRLYTGAQRRAVIVRDRACAWNGCDVPAAFCEVHHIRWWDRDLGNTSVDNGVLLCSHHHHVVHQHDLHITRLRRPPSPTILGTPTRYLFHHRTTHHVINAPPHWADPPTTDCADPPGAGDPAVEAAPTDRRGEPLLAAT
jgi:hypothetical protein